MTRCCAIKILHLSDLHIGKKLFDYSLAEDQQAIFQQIFALIQSRNIDAVVISGDIFHRTAPASAAVTLLDGLLFHLIGVLKVPVLLISGNHDSPARIGYGGNLFALNGLYIGAVLQKQIKKITLQDTFGAVNFFLLPYFAPSEVKSLFDDATLNTSNLAFAKLMEENRALIDPEQRNVLVAHGFFSFWNGSEASLPQVSAEEISVGAADLINLAPYDWFDYTALGHIHSPQQVGKNTIRYSGSPLAYSISEASSIKSACIVELEAKGRCNVETLPLTPLRSVHLLEDSFENLIQKEEYQAFADQFVYANLTDRSLILGAMARLRTVFPYILGLKYPPDEQGDLPLLAAEDVTKLPIDALFERFYADVKGEDLTPAQRLVVKKTIEQTQRQEVEA